MTATINVQLLGHYTIRTANATLQFRTDKIKALFAYLLLQAATPVRRETLATLLWPEVDDGSARKNLRDALFHLRKALDQIDPNLSQQCLDANRKTVTFHIAACFVVDTVELAAPNPTVELAPLLGGELLAGFHVEDAEPFMEWLLLERRYWHNFSLALLARWTEAYLQQSEPELAQQLAQQQLALEPWDEAAHRQAMRAYALARDWAGVAHQYKSCSDVLEAELGIEPSLETDALYQDLGKQQRALEEPKHNLPASLSPFIGRRREVKRINAAIGRGDFRLFTLTGIGGSGKTRLALEVGRQQHGRFPDGVWFVPLASADYAEDVLPAIANAMGLQPVPDLPLARQLYEDLAHKSTLLILDNLEQLPAETADVVLSLLERTANLVILTTTRSRLNLRVERLLPIEGLSFPGAETADDWEQFDAVQFFVEQAERVRFEAMKRDADTVRTIGEICRLLVGVPLAIELAAAQTQEFPIRTVAQRLREGIETLATTMRDVPPRQRSIRAVFEYSWRLLSPAQQQGFARLALFRQPFLAEAAQAVAQISGPDMEALAASLWVKEQTSGHYYLHELLREFGLEQLHLHPEWLEATRQNYVTYHLTLLQDQREMLNKDTSGRTMLRLRQCRADMAHAWHLGIARGAFTELNAGADVLGGFYKESGLLQEGVQLLHALIEEVRAGSQTAGVRPLLANLLFQQASVHAEMTTDGEHFDSLQEVIALATAVNDRRLVVDAQLEQLDIMCRLSQFDEARDYLEPLYREAPKQATLHQQIRILNMMGNILSEKQLYVQAEAHYRAGLALIDPAAEQMTAAGLQHNLALTLTMLGQLTEAEQLQEEALKIWQQAGRKISEGDAQLGLADVIRRQGEYDLARSYLHACLQIFEPVGYIHGMAGAHMALGHIGQALDEIDLAETHYQRLLDVRRRIGPGREQFQGWAGLTEVALARDQIDKAHALASKIAPLVLDDKISGEDAFWVILACYRGLAAAGDSQAEAVLRLAARKLLDQANQLTDPVASHLFLEGVPAHRVLLTTAHEQLPELAAGTNGHPDWRVHETPRFFAHGALHPFREGNGRAWMNGAEEQGNESVTVCAE
ncbi:MAG: tetratricopeptide repeat protein [Caldilineaceae bacterium]|nr:tetratricopeptide repeat protein [Caldilineaceae bacterium]